MYSSNFYGRLFWVDENNDFRSCPENIDGTGDFDCSDYVSEWQDWDGIDYDLLFKIHRSCIINKEHYGDSLLLDDSNMSTKFQLVM